MDKYVSEWKPITELKSVEEDISSFGYDKEYIRLSKIDKRKDLHGVRCLTGQTCFFEPLEIKVVDGQIFYRENDTHVHREVPKTFETQLGVFINENNGEFPSWLEKADTDVESKEGNASQFCINGRFCDMFDYGRFSYAISNLLHGGCWVVEIFRIDERLDVVELYHSAHDKPWKHYEYDGRYEDEKGINIIFSGFYDHNTEPGLRNDFRDRTMLYQIDRDGDGKIIKEWEDIKISSPNSMVVIGDIAYFGQNKMVTCFNINTGEMQYLTHKDDEALSALSKMK